MIDLSPQVDYHKIRVDGATVAYNSRGPDNAKLALIGANGLAGGGDSFWPLLEGVPAEVRVLLPDLPGCGESTEMAQPHTVQGYADWTLRFMDRLNVERAVLISIATGAPITFRCAAQHPDRVAGLIFSLPFLGRMSLPKWMRPVAAYALEVKPLYNLIDKARQSDSLMHRIITHEPPEAIPELAERDIDHKQQASLRAAGELLHDLMLTDGVKELGRLNTPMLFMAAELDNFAPVRTLKALTRNHPERRLVVMPNQGHSWNEEFLQLQNDAIAGFCAALEQG